MRTTQAAMTRQYINNLNRNLGKMNASNNRILENARFTRASQDPVNAAKAYNIRRSLASITKNENTLNTAKGIVESADEVVMKISDIIHQTSEKTLYAVNDTQGPDEREIISRSIANFADDMVKLLNTNYAGRQLFGAQKTDEPPFGTTLDDDGNTLVTFNGKPLNEMTSELDAPLSGDVFVDIGIGMELDKDGNINPQSALNIAFNGAKIMGYGVDADGDPKNIIQLTKNIGAALEKGDAETAVKLKDKLQEAQKSLLIGIAEIGEREAFIDFNLDRLETTKNSMLEASNIVEGTDISEEITQYKVLEFAYNATLQMSSKIIPRSIFDYIG